MILEKAIGWIGQRKLAIAIVAVTIALGVPMSAILLKPSLREYLYREISYQLLADRIAGDETDPERIAIRVADYVEENLYPSGGPVLDVTSWSDLVRGIGWCDQDDWALATLLSKKGIHARFAMLKDKQGGSPHTMAEVFLGGQWRVFDPLFGLAFRNSRDQSLATMSDLSENPSIIFDNPRMRALPEKSRRKLEEFFSRMFPIPEEPNRWGSLLEAKNIGVPRRAVNNVIRLSLSLFGPRVAYLFQDLYLGMPPNRLIALDRSNIKNRSQPEMLTRSEDPALFLYFKARNYHLYERAALAEEFYKEILLRYPTSYYAEKGSYFLGDLSLRVVKNYPSAASRLADFLDKYPGSSWTSLARYSLGMAYEKMGNLEEARRYYTLASSDPYVAAAYRLIELGIESRSGPALSSPPPLGRPGN